MFDIALLTTTLLFGGTVPYAFCFADFVLIPFPAKTAGPLTRHAFSHF